MKKLLDWIDEDGISQRVVAVLITLILMTLIVFLLLTLASRGGA